MADGDTGDLQQSAALAALIVRSATDFAIVTADIVGIITSWSPGAEKVLGWRADEAIGQSVGMFFTPEDRACGRPNIEMKCARDEGCATDERWHMKKDGTRFWANGELQPLREGAGGEIVGFVKILRDRTEHQSLVEQAAAAKEIASAASAQLASEGHRLREMFQSAPGFMAVLRGPDLVYEMVNEAYLQLIGHRDVVGKPIREALPEVAGQGYFEKVDQVFASGQQLTEHNMRVMLQRSAGGEPEMRYVDYVFQPTRDASGVVTGIFIEGFDVTDAVLTRAQGERAAAFQTAVLSQLGEGVIVTDAKGRIRFVNEAATRLHGVARLDVPPEEYSDTYHLLTESGEPYPPTELPLARAVLRGETVNDARWRIRRPDGSEVLAIGNAQPVLADGVQVGAVLTVRDDTERREAEEALAANEERFRELADHIPTLCWTAHADGSIYWYNRRWYKYTGTSPETQEGWGWESVHDPEYLPLVKERWTRSIATSEPFEMVFPLKGGNGQFRQFLTRVVPIFDEGRVVRWFGTNTDIEEQKAAEDALAENRSYLRSLLDSTQEAFYSVDREGVTTLCNAAFVEMLRFRKEEDAVGCKLHDVIHHHHPDGSHYAKEDCPIYQCAQTGASAVVTDEYFFGLDGTRVPVEYRVSPIVRDGTLQGAICTFVDITDRREAEAALKESEARFRRIADSTPVSMWVTGLDRKREFVNRAYVEFLDIDYDEAVDFDWREIIHPDDAARIVAESLAGEASLNSFVLEGRYRRRDGEYRWLRSISQPRMSASGELAGFIGVAHDVTEAKHAEAALRELNHTLESRIANAIAEREKMEEVLRQSQKMEAVGQLTGGIAHDFNNLLTIVSGNIDMARRSLGDEGDAKALRSLGNAMKGADRAASLTQRLLAFSRRQPLQPRATDVDRLINGMIELIDRALGETVALQVDGGPNLWCVEVDPNQLENAILNLAVNARDAMPGGGVLTIATRNVPIDDSDLEIDAGEYVLITVGDTGEGMPAEVLAKAFEPFFSTKEVGKGTGLGLSQVYGYVKQSGGHVSIVSEAGAGTSVSIYLPRLLVEPSRDEEEEAHPAPASHGQEGILVVEDDDDVRIFTVDSLRELGYRVLEAHDGASALRLLERQDEPPRLLLTDVVMPGMSGRELADKARAVWPELQVLYTTGYARDAIVHGGRLDPGVELLLKPFTCDALAAKVREVIAKPAESDPEAANPADND